MVSLSSRILISSTYNKFPGNLSINPRNLRINFRYPSLVVHSKRSSYQDFQEYAKPSRLLPAREVKICTDASVEKVFASSLPAKFESLYKVRLQTSNIYGSGLSDMNTGILLCLIGENGSSILQRLPATTVRPDTWSEDNVIYDTLHFQRGSIDEFAFEGPQLGRIAAVWISLESGIQLPPLVLKMAGQWRIGGVSLTVISHQQPASTESKKLTASQYNFEIEDTLLGENIEASMMEFRPSSVTRFSDYESILFDEESLSASQSLNTYLTSNDESMKEYAYLKFSLLFYDGVLILAGSLIASVSAGENALYAFLTGGLCGFFYLLLLQRSVDGLPAPELVSSEQEGSFGRIFGKLKGPIIVLVLAFAFAVITMKSASGDDTLKLTPKDLAFGMMGFLMCKVSVVLAAFKPMPISFGDNKQSL